ncbi:hypothetical protein AcW1_001632 [Taiwanofungus camphoratus]|nr:hypothetical protein AcW1_001632 [Antrodia cinnamomea]
MFISAGTSSFGNLTDLEGGVKGGERIFTGGGEDGRVSTTVDIVEEGGEGVLSFFNDPGIYTYPLAPRLPKVYCLPSLGTPNTPPFIFSTPALLVDSSKFLHAIGTLV